MINNKSLLSKIIMATRESGSHWFDNKNMRFFGDLRYEAVRSNKGVPLFIQITKKWSDTIYYIVREVDNNTYILSDNIIIEFTDRDDLDNYINNN